ncbi:MAG TPA: ROK family protein [Anaerolineaceae bacterium]|nr:ROK family protein [Anaerolineaceae bacterium]
MLKSQTNQQSTNNILGMNLDGERVLLVYGGLTGSVYETLASPIPNKDSLPTILDQLCIEADKLISLVQAQRLPLPDRISIAITGDYDNETGILHSSDDFPELQDATIRSQISMRFNLPVFMEQKANAGALAEYLFDKGKDARNLVFVSLDPVLRLGILTDGKIYRNLGGTAGNIGLLPTGRTHPNNGASISYNQICSSGGMLHTIINQHLQHWERNVTLPQIIQDANQGDPYALESFAEIGKQLGQSLAGATMLLRPELFFIGYPVCLLGNVFEEAVLEGIAEATGLVDSKLPKVLASNLGVHLPELQALAPACAAYRKP